MKKSPWIAKRFHIVLQLSKVNTFNSETMEIEEVGVARNNCINALKYCYFVKKITIVSNFSSLNKNIVE